MKFLILIIFLVIRHKFTRIQKESLKHVLQSSLQSHSMCIILLISSLVSQGFCQLGNYAVTIPKISVFEFFLNVKKSHIENYFLDNYKIMFEVALGTILYVIYK